MQKRTRVMMLALALVMALGLLIPAAPSYAAQEFPRTLKVDHSKLCLAVAGDSKNNGARIIQWGCNNKPSQDWVIVWMDYHSSGGLYEVRNVGSDKCLDVANFSTKNGGFVTQWDCNHGPNQRWELHVKGQNVKLVNHYSGKCLEVYPGEQKLGCDRHAVDVP